MAENRGGPADVRALLAAEARRLREARDLPADERAGLLADLLTRLDALLTGVADPAVQPLRDLVARLLRDDGRVGTLDERWRAVEQALEELAFDAAARDRRNIAFWRR